MTYYYYYFLNHYERVYCENKLQHYVRDKNTTYLIWLFLGVFGGHRFYTGHFKSGWLMVFTTIVLGPKTFFLPILVWMVVDLAIIDKLIERDTAMLRETIAYNIITGKDRVS